MQTTSSLNSVSTQQANSRPSSDSSLVAAIATREAAAIETLFNRHHAKVYRFALRLTNDASIAEETTSDVFLEVWRTAGKFEGKSQVSTWLLGIARNKAFTALRNRKESQIENDADLTIEDSADGPEASLVKQERSSIVRRCLSHLSPAHREIIDLFYVRGKSVSEVVELIGISANTVKTRMFYARTRMAQLLQEAGVSTALI